MNVTKMSKLYIIRGLPGSGKSTLAKAFIYAGIADEHYEADMYFMVDNKYVFDPTKLSKAHKWCLNKVLAALLDGKNVVVSNTFSTKKEVRPYTILGFEYEIFECTENYGSIHNVPQETIDRMKARWGNDLS